MRKKQLENMHDVHRFMSRVHKNGYWGHHGIVDNGWVGYVMIFGIVMVGLLVSYFFQ